MGLFQTKQAIKFCAIMATLVGFGPISHAQEVEPFSDKLLLKSVHRDKPDALWADADLKIKYTPKTSTSPGSFQVTLDPNGEGSITVDVTADQLSILGLSTSFIAAIDASTYSERVKQKLRFVYDEAMKPGANPVDPTIKGVPTFLTNMKMRAVAKDKIVDQTLELKKQEVQIKVTKKDIEASSASFGFKNIYCCGDPAFNEKLSAYGDEGKAFCPKEAINFSEVGFDKSRLDGSRDDGSTMGCADGTIFCFTETAKCAYFYGDAVIPFEGKMACSVTPTAAKACTPNLATACARENLSLRQGSEGVRESLGRFNRFNTEKKTLIPSEAK